MNTQAGSSKIVAFPTNTIHSIRLCLFQATRRPEMIEKIIETSFGRVRVKGRVGQAHLDVFEAICYSRERKKDVDGRIHILVDPWEVRKRSHQFSGSTLERLIDDLMQVIIEIIEPEHLACTGHLIDHIDKARKADDSIITRDGRFGKRALWTVKIGEAFCKLVMKDIWVGWNPEAIVALDHGISQAVVRHALSHKDAPEGGWKVETLIKAVAGEVSNEVRWKYMEKLRQDAEKMAEIGVLIENGRVKLNKDKKPDA
jgi:hypothetical protein